MQAIKHLMELDRIMIPFLFFPWIITELIEVMWFIIRPSEEINRPSLRNSFSFIFN